MIGAQFLWALNKRIPEFIIAKFKNACGQLLRNVSLMPASHGTERLRNRCPTRLFPNCKFSTGRLLEGIGVKHQIYFVHEKHKKHEKIVRFSRCIILMSSIFDSFVLFVYFVDMGFA